MLLSKERLGKFTASVSHELIPGPRGGTAVRDKCIMRRAEEMVTGMQRNISTFDTRHGEMNEFEAIEEFARITGKIIEASGQQFLQIDENSGATPDAFEKDFNDTIIATVDTKCPTSTFFEQKLMLVNDSKPEFQNSTLQMFVQAQMQMKAATIFNASKGHPPVTKHYLVRYLTSSMIDDDGLKIEIALPIESRMFWKEILFDEHFYETVIKYNIDSAVPQRDAYVKIFKQPINIL